MTSACPVDLVAGNFDVTLNEREDASATSAGLREIEEMTRHYLGSNPEGFVRADANSHGKQQLMHDVAPASTAFQIGPTQEAGLYFNQPTFMQNAHDYANFDWDIDFGDFGWEKSAPYLAAGEMQLHIPVGPSIMMASPSNTLTAANHHQSATPGLATIPVNNIPRPTHIQRRLFRCDSNGCQKTYKRSAELRRHQKVHSLQRDFACRFPHCKRAGAGGFVRRDHLTQHLFQVHQVRN